MANKILTGISFTDAGKKGVSIGYKNFNEKGYIGNTSKDWKALPHEDFHLAMKKLTWHVLFMNEFADMDKFKEFPAAPADEKFRVCGVTITGADDKEGIMITCYRTLKSGKGFSFNTPNTKWNEETYPFMKELEEAWEELKSEAMAYLGGKHGSVQPELPGLEGNGEPGPNPGN